jgi:pilus assembly protein CpaB
MRTKIAILVVALILGGLAAVMAARYLNEARTTIEADSEAVEVLVAQEDIPRGVSSEELIANELIVIEKVPQRYVSAGAVSSEKALEGHVLAAPLSAGEQVTTSRFALPSTAGLAYSIPKDFLAVSIPVDEVKSVSGLVKPGDHVTLFLTSSPGPGGEEDFTKVLLSDAKVLAVGGSLRQVEDEETEDGEGGVISASRDDSQVGTAVRSLTIAVSATDAEKVVYAEEAGEVWAALRPATADELPTTTGQSLKTVYK